MCSVSNGFRLINKKGKVEIIVQIHINAIEKSRVSDIQYVLSKSLDMVCVSDRNKLLEYLKKWLGNCRKI